MQSLGARTVLCEAQIVLLYQPFTPLFPNPYSLSLIGSHLEKPYFILSHFWETEERERKKGSARFSENISTHVPSKQLIWKDF